MKTRLSILLYILAAFALALPSCKHTQKVESAFEQKSLENNTVAESVKIQSDTTILSTDESAMVRLFETESVVIVSETFDSTGSVSRRVTITRNTNRTTAAETNRQTDSVSVTHIVDSAAISDHHSEIVTTAATSQKEKTNTKPTRYFIILLLASVVAGYYIYRQYNR
jgi:hypothetical protein